MIGIVVSRTKGYRTVNWLLLLHENIYGTLKTSLPAPNRKSFKIKTRSQTLSYYLPKLLHPILTLLPNDTKERIIVCILRNTYYNYNPDSPYHKLLRINLKAIETYLFHTCKSDCVHRTQLAMISDATEYMRRRTSGWTMSC